MEKVKVENHSFTAFSWFAAWLFTISFLKLSFVKAAVAIILWPYFIGEFVRGLVF